ncbi:MAG: P1 family peptidase [Pseudomonadota bacterium]
MSCAMVEDRVRARALGVAPGVLEPGPRNDITDVAGVLVGHVTVIEGDEVRTGATAILPHGGNLYRDKVPAGLDVYNGFGKLAGATQIETLGEIETPIVLTNTLAVPRAMDAIVDHTLSQPGNERVRSVNAVVGETNDSGLNDIRKRVLTPEIIGEAIKAAKSAPVEEGAVGAGAGTIAFGWKGGIGSSSRVLPASLGGYTAGVLVQSNYGGVLQIDGAPVGAALGQYYLKEHVDAGDGDGSIMMIVATDAPLSDRNLKRLARRAHAGLARTGSAMTNGSGDYAIAFSTAQAVRRGPEGAQAPDLANDKMSPLFQAVIEATEEAIYNSLFMATTTEGFNVSRQAPNTIEALPLDKVREILKEHNSLD